MDKKILAIIPCKKESLRLPNKNKRILGDKPLWLHSVYYAINENCEFVVSTDDLEIIEYCKEHNYPYFKENVDDTNMVNCIRQNIDKFNPYIYCLLQPTSPIRKKGVLKKIVDTIINNLNINLIYTAQRIKPLGLITTDNKPTDIIVQTRLQDAKYHLLQYDGSILCQRVESFNKSNKIFIDDTSTIQVWEQTVPYSLQIDYEEEFNLLDMIYNKTCIPS